jgi:hypothetical protein
MVANSSELLELETTAGKPKPLRKFGQNVLGIIFHSDDWEKDIPLEYFQDEGKENPFGNGGSNG